MKQLCPDRDPQDREQAVQDLKLPASQPNHYLYNPDGAWK
jgi:hypothetical protein